MFHNLSIRFPHTRGDEPSMKTHTHHLNRVFPTPVGMNRDGAWFAWNIASFPHTRGDEPLALSPILAGHAGFPHTRGDEPIRRPLRQSA